MDYINIDYVYATLWLIFFLSFLRLGWKYWKSSDKVDAGMNVCLSLLCVILAVLTFKGGVGS